jgi:hypothetical protein
VQTFGSRTIAELVSLTTKKNKHRCALEVCLHAAPTIFNRTKTMNTKDLIRLGVPVGEPLALAHEFIHNFIAQGKDGAQLEAEIFNIVANPPAFFSDELRGPLARAIYRPAFTPRAELPLRRLRGERSAVEWEALPRGAFAPWRQWGEGLEAEAVKQMANACALPVAVAGALMPDAHVGYGLPIGGVLATDNAGLPLRRLRSYRSAFGGVRFRAVRSLRRRRGHRVPHEADRL